LTDIKFWDLISREAGMEISRQVKELKNAKGVWELVRIGTNGMVRGVKHVWQNYVNTSELLGISAF